MLPVDVFDWGVVRGCSYRFISSLGGLFLGFFSLSGRLDGEVTGWRASGVFVIFFWIF